MSMVCFFALEKQRLNTKGTHQNPRALERECMMECYFDKEDCSCCFCKLMVQRWRDSSGPWFHRDISLSAAVVHTGCVTRFAVSVSGCVATVAQRLL